MNPNTRKPTLTDLAEFNAESDRQFRTARRVAIVWVLFVMALYGTLAAGAIFVGYKILTHFGIL